MADHETIPIGLETQNKVAEAIYLRWYSNGARHPRPWNEMPMEGKEPWRRVAKDAITMFLLTPVFLLALAGCGSASKTSTPAHAIAATGTTCSKMSSDNIKECIVTLSDTRQVDCVVYSGYQRGGLSCDWSHVSGADKEPAR